MQTAARLVSGLAALAVMTGSAFAQGLNPGVLTGPVSAAPVSEQFQWGGFYVGLFGGIELEVAPLSIDDPVVGIQAGYDFLFGQTLVGVSAEYGAFGLATPADYVSFGGRIGVLAGNRALFYVEPSLISFIPSASILFWSVGGGVEYGIGRNISVFAETGIFSFFGASFLELLFEFGFNLHLGR